MLPPAVNIMVKAARAVGRPAVVHVKVDTGLGRNGVAPGEWAADMGEGLRGRLQIRQRSRDRANVTRAHRLDAKLASGHALTRPYAVVCVTVAKTMRVAEFGRRLDASIRRAGFAPLRLDLAQDAGFAAATLPLGLGLTRKADE